MSWKINHIKTLPQYSPGLSQSGRNAGNIVVRELTDPIPDFPLSEGKGAGWAGRGVYSVKLVDSTKMFDLAIALDIHENF